MKCRSCGGTLDSNFNTCPYCGTRAEVDFLTVNFRDLGTSTGLPCPDCSKPLNSIEFNTNPPITIERCDTCYGCFFNPGEIELLLEQMTSDIIWLDEERISNLNKDRDHDGQTSRWAKCPICSERMSPMNFGGESGVILDRCGKHGLWAENGEFRQISEWWHAGGKLLYEKNQHELAVGKTVAPGDEMMSQAAEGYYPPPMYDRDEQFQADKSPGSLSRILSFLFK